MEHFILLKISVQFAKLKEKNEKRNYDIKIKRIEYTMLSYIARLKKHPK